MSQTAITLAFEHWKAQQGATGEPVLLDEFVFANVPGLDTDAPIPRDEAMPPADQIVYRGAVSRKGVVNENAVVHSVVLGADVGDFSFNWIGLINKTSGTLAMIVHAPLQQKLKNKEGQQGNVLTRSFLMEYNGAQTETGINTPAETWQIDFTARMAGMDERQRLENIDIYGAAAFFGDGYLVAKTGNQFYVTRGTGYVAGLRTQLNANKNITVTTKPVKVWLDVCWTGTLTSVWSVESKITVAADLSDYVSAGVQHYVFALASIDENGNITDLRPKGTLDSQQGKSDYLRKDKNLADIQNAAEARNHLELGSAAQSDTQISRDDTTPGRVLVNGSAIATRSVSASSFDGAYTDDANNLPCNSVSFVYASAKHSPGFEASILDYAGLSGSYNTQFAASYAQPGKLRFRTKNGDNDQWNPWMDIITTTGGTINGSLRVDSGIGLGTDNVLGGNSIALGDNDTGFKQNGDGVLDLIANNVQVMRITNNAAQINNWSGSWINMREQICYSGQNIVSNDSASAIVRQEHQDRHFYIGGLGNYQFGFYMTNKSRSENGTDGQAYMDNEGNWLCGKNIQAGDAIKTGGGASTIGANGDIWGPAWGNNWLSVRINAMATSEWVRQWFVQDVSRGAQGSMTMDGALVEAPSGCFLTGGNGNEGNQVGVALYRPLQIWRGNGWATISG